MATLRSAGPGMPYTPRLGLTVAESLLLRCSPFMVEGASEQHYLSGIKTLLIASGRLKPGRELVFPPAGGTKGVKAVASVLGGRDEELPVALFDSDTPGQKHGAISARWSVQMATLSWCWKLEAFCAGHGRFGN